MIDYTRRKKASPQQGDLRELLTINDISSTYSVSLRALRYYEERGLLKPFRRDRARFYDSVQVARLEKIIQGKHLGLTLAEIAEFVDASGPTGPSNDLGLDEKTVLSQLRLLKKRRADLDQAIAELQAVHRRMTNGAK